MVKGLTYKGEFFIRPTEDPFHDDWLECSNCQGPLFQKEVMSEIFTECPYCKAKLKYIIYDLKTLRSLEHNGVVKHKDDPSPTISGYKEYTYSMWEKYENDHDTDENMNASNMYNMYIVIPKPLEMTRKVYDPETTEMTDVITVTEDAITIRVTQPCMTIPIAGDVMTYNGLWLRVRSRIMHSLCGYIELICDELSVKDIDVIKKNIKDK